jgi:hypothetical protein
MESERESFSLAHFLSPCFFLFCPNDDKKIKHSILLVLVLIQIFSHPLIPAHVMIVTVSAHVQNDFQMCVSVENKQQYIVCWIRDATNFLNKNKGTCDHPLTFVSCLFVLVVLSLSLAIFSFVQNKIDVHHISCISQGATSVEFDEIVVECTSTRDGETVFNNYVAQYELACFSPASPSCTAYNDTFCTEMIGFLEWYYTGDLDNFGHTNVSCLAVDGSEYCRYFNNTNHIDYDRDFLTCFNAIAEWEVSSSALQQLFDVDVNCENVGNSVVCSSVFNTGTMYMELF